MQYATVQGQEEASDKEGDIETMKVTTKLWIFLWTSVIFTDFVSAVTRPCQPAEENKRYTLSCPSNNKNMHWKLGNGNQLALCEKSPCIVTDSDITSVTWNSSFSTFSVKNMSRTSVFYLKEILCSHPKIADQDEILISMCTLKSVYARPQKPTCGIPSVSDTDVTLTCQTEKIYPTAVCEFYNKTIALHGTVTYNNGNLVNQTTDHYRPQCTITLSLGSDIGPGVHLFKVLMYPDVPGGIDFGDESDLTSVVNLALPSASLSTSCSSGVNVTENYIKEGTTVSCQCNRDKDGNPPGRVEWLNSSNQPVPGRRDTTAVLTVSVDPNGQSPDFICRGVSALGHGMSGVSFKKEIAFGPTLVNVLDDKGYNHYDLCPPNRSIQLTVYCEVPVTNVNPEPTITVSINGMSPSKETSVTNTTHYRRKSVFTLTTSGRHEVKCLAKNSVFPTIQKQDTLAVTISAPPVSEPHIRLANGNLVNNGETASVTKGDVISCYVEGGYPPTDVTLTCESGNSTPTVVHGSMESFLRLSSFKTTINCTCTATHAASVCLYNKRSSFTLDIYQSMNKERTKETAIVGGVLGGLLIIMFGVVIFLVLVLRRKEKMLCCYKKDTDHGQKFSDPKTTQANCPDAQIYMDQHQNEAFDGYEVPVTPHLTSHYENSLAPGNADKGIPTVNTKPEKRENVEYENTF